MNAGVSTSPWGVVNHPTRAEPQSWAVRNENSVCVLGIAAI